jgi:hypothetical protein
MENLNEMKELLPTEPRRLEVAPVYTPTSRELEIHASIKAAEAEFAPRIKIETNEDGERWLD